MTAENICGGLGRNVIQGDAGRNQLVGEADDLALGLVDKPRRPCASPTRPIVPFATLLDAIAMRINAQDGHVLVAGPSVEQAKPRLQPREPES